MVDKKSSEELGYQERVMERGGKKEGAFDRAGGRCLQLFIFKLNY